MGIGNSLLSLSRPHIVNVLGIAPSSFCTNDHARARIRVTHQIGRVISRKTTVVSVNTCSSHPGTSGISTERRVRQLHVNLGVLFRVRPSTIISMSAFETSITEVYIRRCNITVVGSVTTNRVSTGVFRAITTLGMPCVVVRVRNAPRDVRRRPRCSGLLGRIFLCFTHGIRRLHSLNMGSVVLSLNFNFKGAVRRGCRLLSRLRRFHVFRLPLLMNISHGSVVCHLLSVAPRRTLGNAAILSAVYLLGNTSVLHMRSIGRTIRAMQVIRTVQGGSWSLAPGRSVSYFLGLRWGVL